MPDEFLYPVKLATERVRLVLTPSTLGKAELYAKLADRRVLEIVRMAGKSKPEQIEQTARRLDTYLKKIADLASTQEVTGARVVAPAAEEALAVEEVPALKEVPEVEKAPAAEEALAVEEAPALKEVPKVEKAPALEKAPAAKEALALPERAREGKEVRIGVDRRSRLKATVMRYADNHSARLRAALKTVPQSAKLALRRAIDVSETGYEKVLKSLD